MTSVGSVLKACDNSGARFVRILRVIKPHTSSNRLALRLGCLVVVSVVVASTNKRLSKGSVQKAIVVRLKRQDNFRAGTLKFDDNAVVLLHHRKKFMPAGSRVFGPVSRLLLKAGFTRIVSLAESAI